MTKRQRKTNNKRHIYWRYSLVVFVMIVFSTWIVWDMFKTTVLYQNEWNKKANSILTKVEKLEPERGKLLADNGTVLAANLTFYTARIDWKSNAFVDSLFHTELPALCDSLAAFEPSRDAKQWKEVLTEAYNSKPSRAWPLFKHSITHGELARLKKFPFFKLGANKSGFYANGESRRTKPYGAMASRSIGLVADDSVNQGLHGRSGLEMALDSLLYGIPGESKYIQLTTGIVKGEKIAPTSGYDITTTINVALQDIVENELYKMCVETGAKWGTCVLMEVNTGEIKAISNLEKNAKTGEYIEGRNNAVLGYEPGSVMKPISMMVALEDGIVKDIDAPMATGSMWNYEGSAISDPHGGGSLTPRQIIEVSSNVGMSRIIVSKYGKNPGGFYDRLKGMGFFDPINSGIGGETTPKIRRLGKTKGDRIALTRMAYGYTTEIPPLSTLAIYNAIANDGKYVRPHLVKKLSREGQPDSIVPVSYIRERVCSSENARKLRIMLHDVVWGNRGTARKWVQDDRVEIAGKTGTAYMVEGGQYTSMKRMAFCGFFPYENPKYSCIVLLAGSSMGAGASSGVVLKNVALKMYARGLLGNSPTYLGKADKDGKQLVKNNTQPTFFASVGKQLLSNVRKGLMLGDSKVKVMKSPEHQEKGRVPNVCNLNVRDAIRELEQAGLAVRFSGAGFVATQSIKPGTEIRQGEIINLSLRN